MRVSKIQRHLVRLGNQGEGGQHVTQVDLRRIGIELTDAVHPPREVHEDFEVFVRARA